jgi:hypothetical protein
LWVAGNIYGQGAERERESEREEETILTFGVSTSHTIFIV